MLSLFGGGTRKIEGLATQVERSVEAQRTRKGTQVGGAADLQTQLSLAQLAEHVLLILVNYSGEGLKQGVLRGSIDTANTSNKQALLLAAGTHFRRCA